MPVEKSHVSIQTIDLELGVEAGKGGRDYATSKAIATTIGARIIPI